MATLSKEQVLDRLNSFINNPNYTEISSKKFHEIIGNKDIITSVNDPYNFPYVSDFKFRHGTLVGKAIPDDVHCSKDRYFILKEFME
ncbi:hypothetical protein HZP59_08800 [Elizabethkingia anophelis]|nr:hypothetical protein [Elizabethkingia anophelis]